MKSTNLDGVFKYIITASDSGFEYTFDKYTSSHNEIEFVMTNLQPGTRYNISVNIEYSKEKISTECLTKPETGTKENWNFTLLFVFNFFTNILPMKS